MERLKILRFSLVFVCLLNMSLISNGEEELDEGAVDVPSTPMMRAEQEALYSAIQGFVGKWWNGSDLYPDPCGWTPIQGVSCDLFDGFWYVTELEIGAIHDNSLSCNESVEFAHQVFDLRHLRTLSFFSCFLSRPVSIPARNWEALAGSLESLTFRSNPGLTGQVPEAFGQLKNLQSLVLEENSLTGDLPRNLGSLTNLRRLNLAGNLFTGRIPDTFGCLNHLLILDVSRNLLTGFLPDSIGALDSLLKLDLSHNQLEGKIIPDGFRNLRNLTLLDLRNNRLSGKIPKSITEMRSLQELALSGNPTGGDIMTINWKTLTRLTALDLANMSLTGGIPDSISISKLKGLRFIGLNDNKLTGEIPTTLEDISAIYIHGNNLTGQLKFSEGFYRKMGRRFGAWDNPNLCCPMGLVYAPFGVKLCLKQGMGEKDEAWYKSTVGIESWDPEYSESTPGFGKGGCNGFVLLVGILTFLIFN